MTTSSKALVVTAEPGLRGGWRRVAVRAALGMWGLGVLLMLSQPYLLGVVTPSVPVGLYRLYELPSAGVQVGDYVCMQAWRDRAPESLKRLIELGIAPTSWLHGQTLVKQVVGRQGDRITRSDAGIHVNGALLPDSRVLTHSQGREIPPVHFPIVLGPGQVWLGSRGEKACDSRYLGAVHVEQLTCRAELLWRW